MSCLHISCSPMGLGQRRILKLKISLDPTKSSQVLRASCVLALVGCSEMLKRSPSFQLAQWCQLCVCSLSICKGLSLLPMGMATWWCVGEAWAGGAGGVCGPVGRAHRWNIPSGSRAGSLMESVKSLVGSAFFLWTVSLAAVFQASPSPSAE